ncbi:MAG TPA: peptidoglycan DD-metalloendopeptidase family protein [Candidatus Acidoferrales bacterium]|nr:peptidoglycan DD-metalloendopeptidase family protein [Candidatus Acidoferrales bacterium]
MKSKSYTLFIAANDSGGVRRLRIPLYVLHLFLVLAVVGGLTVIFAAGSYSRMLWKVTNYNTLRREQDSLKKQYLDLQTQVKDTNERLTSLQSLAGEVAMAYGLTNLRQTPFAISDSYQEPETEFRQSVAEFNYLQTNASMVTAASPNLRLMPAPQFASSSVAPSLWPVVGEITGRFGERLDPFSGEGAFHAGVDIASHLGDAVRATADGVVTVVDRRAGYGRLVIIDHGFGVTTWYGHMLEFNTSVGAQVKRGDIIGFEGATGHATGPHVHYEVRFYNTPVNPWRYLRGAEVSPTQNGD